MARYRKRRKTYRRKRTKGILSGISLYFTSKARLKGMALGLVVSPIVTAYTQTGRDVATWIVKQTGRLRGN